MATNNIEVELRGPLDEAGYQKTLAFLRSEAKFSEKQNRLILDYSTFIEGIGERALDVRIRVTNGKIEIIVKRGKFGGTSREESSVSLDGEDLDGAMGLMNLLGYSKAVACDRGIERYVIEGIEIAIQEVRDLSIPGKIHSRFYEAEIMTDESGKEAAIRKIEGFLSAHDLKVFSETDWNEYISKINKEANGVFEYGADPVEVLSRLGRP